MDTTLVAAIPTTVIFDEGVWYVVNEPILIWGVGETKQEASNDFTEAVGELYALLEEEGPSNLGPIPLKQLEYLRQHVKETVTYTV